MHAPVTMPRSTNLNFRRSPQTRLPQISILRWGTALASILFLGSALVVAQTPARQAPAPPLTADHDPVRSPDPEPVRNAPEGISKESSGYTLHSDVEEVSLNVTVLDGHGQIVQT